MPTGPHRRFGILASLSFLLLACSDAETAQVTGEVAPGNSTAEAVAESAAPIPAVREVNDTGRPEKLPANQQGQSTSTP